MLKDIALGKVITDEQYNTILAQNPDLKNNFVKTLDGYTYVGGANAKRNIENAYNNPFKLNEAIDTLYNAQIQGKDLISAYFNNENGQLVWKNGKGISDLLNNSVNLD